MATLYSKTTSCLGLFVTLTALTDRLESGSEDDRSSSPIAQIQNQAARLKVWAGCLLVKGDRVPLVDTMDDDAILNELEESTNSEDSGSLQMDNELSFNLAEIVDLLSDLHRLSFRIRNPGYQKHSRYEKEDILRINGLVVDFHLQNGQELDSTFSYLIERVGVANTNRHRCFAYWKSHYLKLADVPRRAHASTPRAPYQTDLLPDPGMTRPEALAVGMARTNTVSEQRTINSGTEATRFTQKLDFEWEAQSQVSMSTSYDVEGEYTHPPAPSIVTGSREHRCTYCHLACPVKHFKGQAWRKHVLQDFQPYVCTYKQCQEADALFPDRVAWKEHERLVHRRIWFCFEHPNVVMPRSSVEGHLAEHHTELNASQIHRLLGITESDRPDERSRCPFCGSEGPFNPDLADHIACHMERFAMIASPLVSDGDKNHRSSDSHATISGGAASRPRLSSFSGFRSVASETRDADTPFLNTLVAEDELESKPITQFEHQLKFCTRFSVYDEKVFVLDRRLLEWFRSPDASESGTNASCILWTLPGLEIGRIANLEAHMGDTDKLSWLRVFSILLQLGKGVDIRTFWLLEGLDPQLPFSLT
ncbi:hypothetical protein PG994_012436 [Apiospora phragmitis]|uniref:C2H2-type domain-containing protein n=1 Tax=Apiospora phragmitis TaxID=2905665 RepID=A0ABR1TXX1_9PEZI